MAGEMSDLECAFCGGHPGAIPGRHDVKCPRELVAALRARVESAERELAQAQGLESWRSCGHIAWGTCSTCYVERGQKLSDTEAKLAAAERRAEEMRRLLAEAALPLEALSWAAQWEIAPAILTQIDAVLPQIRAALAPLPASDEMISLTAVEMAAAHTALMREATPAPATCWWDAPADSHACPLHGASVFLCPDAKARVAPGEGA